MNSEYSCDLNSGFLVLVERLPTKRVGEGVAYAMVGVGMDGEVVGGGEGVVVEGGQPTLSLEVSCGQV